MSPHVIRQGAQTNGGEKVDGKARVFGVVKGKETRKAPL
jgi:hypothetical protein